MHFLRVMVIVEETAYNTISSVDPYKYPYDTSGRGFIKAVRCCGEVAASSLMSKHDLFSFSYSLICRVCCV